MTLWGGVVISLVDNFLRPRLVGRARATLTAAAALLGARLRRAAAAQ